MSARRARATAPLLAAAVIAAAVALPGCGGGHHAPPRPSAPPATTAPVAPPAPPATNIPAAARPAIGLDEPNPHLLAVLGGAAGQFDRWRGAVDAARPRYLRFVINWARVQPAPGGGPRWDLPVDGCLRGIPPCGAYAGVRDQLRAVAERRRAGQPVDAVITIAGVPAWAARAPGGCERAGTGAFSRPLNAAGWSAYAQLLASLISEAQQDGAGVPYLSPWNEPNHPTFLSPQRASCATAAPSLAAGVYARMARAADMALAAAGARDHLLLGELAGYGSSSPRRASIGEFVASLPPEVSCLPAVWAVHNYASPSSDGVGNSAPVAELEAALAHRAACPGARSPVWVTETGAGARVPGRPRAGDAEARAGCRALAAALARWAADPSVGAVFQYTFREDTAYPVGLADAGLTRLYPSYWLLRAWGRRAPDAPSPALPSQCRA